LEEEICMKVVPGSKYEGTGKVYKLVKSIYGLKQSLMIWHKTMDRVLINSGFVKNSAESCLCLKKIPSGPVLIRPYVDDLLIAIKDPGEMTKTKNWLASKFRMKDLGLARKVLGMTDHYTE
jgi:hypothetical protein